MLTEVIAGSLGNTVYIPAPFDDVEVYLVHPVFADGIGALHEPYDEDFLQFAGNGLVAVEEYVLDELHGDGAAAPFECFFFEINGNGRPDGLFYETLVAEKRRVFGGEDGVFQVRGYPGQRHEVRIFRSDDDIAYRLLIFIGGVRKGGVDFGDMGIPPGIDLEIVLLHL